MTSKIAKCERIFSNGESSIKLEIDYQTKRYSIRPCGDDLGWEFKFLNREVSEIPKDLALLDLMSQAIKFAEEELKSEEKEIQESAMHIPDKVKAALREGMGLVEAWEAAKNGQCISNKTVTIVVRKSLETYHSQCLSDAISGICDCHILNNDWEVVGKE